MSKFKAGQTYRTRNQSIARVYAVDDTTGNGIHGAVADGYFWEIMSWDEKGKFSLAKTDSAWDLMPDTEYFYCVAFLSSIGNVLTKIFDSEKKRDRFANALPCEFKTFELEKI